MYKATAIVLLLTVSNLGHVAVASQAAGEEEEKSGGTTVGMAERAATRVAAAVAGGVRRAARAAAALHLTSANTPPVTPSDATPVRLYPEVPDFPPRVFGSVWEQKRQNEIMKNPGTQKMSEDQAIAELRKYGASTFNLSRNRPLEQFPQFWDNHEVVKAAVEAYPLAFASCDHKFLGDGEIALLSLNTKKHKVAVENCRKIGLNLKSDKVFIKRAIETYPLAFIQASENIRRNDEIALNALFEAKQYKTWVGGRFNLMEIFDAFVGDKSDISFMKRVVEIYPLAFVRAPETIRENREVAELALKSPQVQEKRVQLETMFAHFISDRATALANICNATFGALRHDEKLIEMAVNMDCHVFPKLNEEFRRNQKIALVAINCSLQRSEMIDIFFGVPNDLKSNRHFMFEAIKIAPVLFSNSQFTNDGEIALSMLQKYKGMDRSEDRAQEIYESLGDVLKQDTTFMAKALEHYGSLIQHVNRDFLNDEAFMGKAIQQNANNFKLLSPEMKVNQKLLTLWFSKGQGLHQDVFGDVPSLRLHLLFNIQPTNVVDKLAEMQLRRNYNRDTYSLLAMGQQQRLQGLPNIRRGVMSLLGGAYPQIDIMDLSPEELEKLNDLTGGYTSKTLQFLSYYGPQGR